MEYGSGLKNGKLPSPVKHSLTGGVLKNLTGVFDNQKQKGEKRKQGSKTTLAKMFWGCHWSWV